MVRVARVRGGAALSGEKSSNQSSHPERRSGGTRRTARRPPFLAPWLPAFRLTCRNKERGVILLACLVTGSQAVTRVIEETLRAVGHHARTLDPSQHTGRAPLFSARRHADHGWELRQDRRAVPHPCGPRPPLPRSGAAVPSPLGIRADAVCKSARLGARRAHPGRRAGVVDALLIDLLRCRRVLLHWYPRCPGSGERLLAVPFRMQPAQHCGD